MSIFQTFVPQYSRLSLFHGAQIQMIARHQKLCTMHPTFKSGSQYLNTAAWNRFFFSLNFMIIHGLRAALMQYLFRVSNQFAGSFGVVVLKFKTASMVNDVTVIFWLVAAFVALCFHEITDTGNKVQMLLVIIVLSIKIHDIRPKSSHKRRICTGNSLDKRSLMSWTTQAQYHNEITNMVNLSKTVTKRCEDICILKYMYPRLKAVWVYDLFITSSTTNVFIFAKKSRMQANLVLLTACILEYVLVI